MKRQMAGTCPKCGEAESSHSYGLCPAAGIVIPQRAKVGARVIQRDGELYIACNGDGFAEVFGEPTYREACAAWREYLRTHGYRVGTRCPRGFANEIDYIVGTARDLRAAGITPLRRLPIRRLALGGTEYGRIELEEGNQPRPVGSSVELRGWDWFGPPQCGD